MQFVFLPAGRRASGDSSRSDGRPQHHDRGVRRGHRQALFLSFFLSPNVFSHALGCGSSPSLERADR